MSSAQELNYKKVGEIVECINENSWLEHRFSKSILLSKKFSKSAVLQMIIESGFDVNYKLPIDKLLYQNKPQCGNNTILHYFVEFYSSSYKNYVELMVKNGADITLKNDDGYTPILLAFHKKVIIDPLLIAYLKGNYSIDVSDPNGITHFHAVCSTNLVEVVEFFIKKGVSINKRVSDDSSKYPGYTPLHFAVLNYQFQTIQLLLTEGAKWNVKDAHGITPLHLFIKILFQTTVGKKCIEIEKILTEAFCLNTLSLPDGMGLSNFHIAVILNKHEFVDRICEREKNILDRCIKFKSPIWPGYTPLHFACQANFETFILLLEKGADLLAKDANGKTPFDLLSKMYYTDRVIEILTTEKRHQLSQIKFTDGTLILDALCAMRKIDDLEEFMRNKIKDVNAIIPLDSPIWAGCNLLHLAVIFGTSVRILLQRKVDLSKINSDGMSPLHLAFRLKRTCMTKFIVESNHKDLYSNLIDRDNLSHLHIFCTVDNYGVDLLLQNGADPNLPLLKDIKYGDNRVLRAGSTPFHALVRRSHLSYLIKKFLSFGANLNAPDADGVTPLQLIMKLENSHPYLNNFTSREKLTIKTDLVPLISAALEGGRKILDSIISEEIYYPDKMSDSFKSRIKEFINDGQHEYLGWTKLHVACAAGWQSMIKKELESGADINQCIALNAPLCPGDTPIHMLFRKRLVLRPGIINLLYEYGADPTILNKENLTPIHESRDGHLKEEKLENSATLLLRSKHFKVNPVNKRGLSHFHICCKVQNVWAVKKLLKSGVDVNASVNLFAEVDAGYTPLHFAVESCNDKIIKLLLRYGADPNIKNGAGFTSFHMAASASNDKFSADRVETLLRYPNIDIEAANTFGETVLEMLLNKPHACDQLISFIVNSSSSINFTKFTAKKNNRSTLIVKAAAKLPPQTFQNLIEKIPGLKEIDDKGQNVIHHIILANQFSSRTFENIEVLIRNGCDLNHKDNKGETALHKVTCLLGNARRLNQLLSLGADVNMKDDEGRTPYACTSTEDFFSKIRLVFTSHIEILELAGLYIDESNKIKRDRQVSKVTVGKIIKEKCKLDDKLKKEVQSSFSADYFYSEQFIADYRRMPITVRRALRNICDLVDLSQNFPKTHSLIKLQYRKARARTRLLEPAGVAFQNLFNLSIPEPCVESILKYLNNDDLMNLIRAENGKLLLVPLPENC